MTTQTCPTCGRCMTPTLRRKAAPRPDTDTAALSDVQLFAHYKATSHIGDVRFFVARTADPVLAARGEALLLEAEAGLKKADTLRQLHRLQDAWRRLALPRPALSAPALSAAVLPAADWF